MTPKKVGRNRRYISKYYVPDELRMRIGELYDESYGSKMNSSILGLNRVYVGWMLQRYRVYGKQGLNLKGRSHISYDGKVEVVTDIINNSLTRPLPSNTI